MISFYPGPSRVEDKIPSYVRDAYAEGILSMNHRSPEFIALSKKTIGLLKQKLKIPKDFTIFFTSSATECWEIIAQSLVTRESIHYYNGAFGEKWFTYTQKLKPAKGISFTYDQEPDSDALISSTGDIICLTQNETSNGTQLSNKFISVVQKNNPDHLIAVDVTSSMAGITLDFKAADVWIASVQKCFGMPAGLGLMVVSPKGIAHIKKINEASHYNSMTLMAQMMEQWQTSFTPNVLAIYLLMRVMNDREPISVVHRQTKQRFDAWTSFFAKSQKLKLLTNRPRLASYTVLAVAADEELVIKIKKDGRKHGLLVGEGYGSQKKSTFRIANFPALKEKEIKNLKKFLSAYL